MFVIACGNGTIMLDFVEEALNEIAALVGARTERRRVEPMIERTNVGDRALGCDLGAERVTVVAAIGQQDAFARQCHEHVLGAFAVVGLTFSQLQRDREPERIDEGVDFGRKPATGAAHATTSTAFFSPFAAC